MQTYDFAVIGGGSAGYAAAATAGGLGLQTICIEGGQDVGGLCILRGCMPSKTLIESANRFLTLRRSADFGLSAGHLGFDSAAIIRRKRELISGFADYRVGQLKTGNFDFVRGVAELLAPERVRIHSLSGGGAEEIEAKTCLISTGSELNLVNVPGLREAGFLHSDLALDSEVIPRSIVILGGGAICLEFAHFYEALGTRVTIIQRSGQVIKEADADVAEAVVKAYRHRGMQVICDTKLLGVHKSDGQKLVRYQKDGKELTTAAEEIFYALGRRPAVGKLNLRSAGLEQSPEGAVTVNSCMQTTQPNIFAAGDVTGLYEVVHLAIEQGVLAAENAKRFIEGKKLKAMDYRLKLYAIFSEPQVAFVGLTEKEAGQAGIAVRVATYPFCDHGKSIIRGETDGFVKLVTDARTGEIVGGAVVGPEASELIHEIVVAMYFRATAADLASIPHYHPTLSEIWTYPAAELGLKESTVISELSCGKSRVSQAASEPRIRG
jgi:pyruvate/2-oxoglutarate dehydrogenase complex dihydrolipoamide dehydrogenase (E3) component